MSYTVEYFKYLETHALKTWFISKFSVDKFSILFSAEGNHEIEVIRAYWYTLHMQWIEIMLKVNNLFFFFYQGIAEDILSMHNAYAVSRCPVSSLLLLVRRDNQGLHYLIPYFNPWFSLLKSNTTDVSSLQVSGVTILDDKSSDFGIKC